MKFKDNYNIYQRRIVKAILDNNDAVSAVPINSDYKNDASLSLTCVAFPSKAMVEWIEDKLISYFKLYDKRQYFYPKSSLHMTIKNIRSISNPPSYTKIEINTVNKVLNSVIPNHCPINISFEEIVCFKNSLSLIGYSDKDFGNLVIELDRELKLNGIIDDKKYISDEYFFGNITFCRFTDKPKIEFLEEVKKLSNQFSYEMKIDEAHLITANGVCAKQSRNITHSYSLK